MKQKFFILVLFLTSIVSQAQTAVYKDKSNKWGIREGKTDLVPPVYDTIFNFDSTGKVCLACFRHKSAHPNKFIKNPVISFHCNYLSRDGKKLLISQKDGDTTSIFTLQKTSWQNYSGNGNYMSVAVKDKNLMDHKHLVDKDLKQHTFKGYEDISVAPDPAFLIARIRTESNTVMTGLLDRKEEVVLPFKYSFIKFNTVDSLIIGCTAGQGMNSEDDIFNYEAKKVASYHRHIELATKKFIVERVFQPKEYLIIINLETKEEQIEHAEEVHYHSPDKLLMMNDDHWYTYDLYTHKKKSYDLKHKKQDESRH